MAPVLRRRVWVLLRFKERLVQMAMRRSAIQQARATGKVSPHITSLLEVLRYTRRSMALLRCTYSR